MYQLCDDVLMRDGTTMRVPYSETRAGLYCERQISLTYLPTGEVFVKRRTFLNAQAVEECLRRWNAQQPERWRYEVVAPTPVDQREEIPMPRGSCAATPVLEDPRLREVLFALGGEGRGLRKLVPCADAVASCPFTSEGAIRRDRARLGWVAVSLAMPHAGRDGYQVRLRLSDADDWERAYWRPATWENWLLLLDWYSALTEVDPEILALLQEGVGA